MPVTRAGQRQRQQTVEELCAAALRAISGDRALALRGGQLYRGGAPYPATAPQLHPSVERDDFGSFRGAADGWALRRRYSDSVVHQRLRPDHAVAGAVFDLLEQFRVESLVPQELPGVSANVRLRHRSWSAELHRAGVTETATGILLYTVAEVCRARVVNEPVPTDVEDLIEATRFGLAAAIGESLVLLRNHRDDQASYAETARSLAEHVASLVADSAAALPQRARTSSFSALDLFLDPAGELALASVPDPGVGHGGETATVGYRVFTHAYDREHSATDLVSVERLAVLRTHLDARIANEGVNVSRLALQFQRLLLAEPAREGWDFEQEEGEVDGRRLAGLVTRPSERHLFRQERLELVSDTLVTFLLDCSGSMRAHHEALVVTLDVLLRALDQAGVSSELLGFTTGAWNGGRPARDWRRAGRPSYPGRLNELSHLVVKDADASWRRARLAIAALLAENLYREGVDGEALAWAWSRMQRRSDGRRILVVVTDGSPMDSATNLANGPLYLDRHLRQVINGMESRAEVEVCGVGVGADISPFYAHSVTVDPGAQPVSAICRAVVELLAGRHHR